VGRDNLGDLADGLMRVGRTVVRFLCGVTISRHRTGIDCGLASFGLRLVRRSGYFYRHGSPVYYLLRKTVRRLAIVVSGGHEGTVDKVKPRPR